MSDLITQPASSTVSPSLSVNARRRLSGISLIVCGLALAAAFAVPHAERDNPLAFQAFVRHDYSLIVFVGIISLVVVLSMVAGVAGLHRVVAGRRPVLSTVGSSILLSGFMSYLLIVGTDNATAALALGAGQSTVASALDVSSNTALYDIALVLFLVGHIVGPIIICIAVWRAAFAPWFLALILPVGALGHLIAESAGLPGLDVASFAVFGLGFVTLGVLMLRPWRL
jgi:hypothetical protein